MLMKDTASCIQLRTASTIRLVPLSEILQHLPVRQMFRGCIQFDLIRKTPILKFNHYVQNDYSDFTPHKDRDSVNFTAFMILCGSCSLMIKQIIRSKG